MSTLNRLYSALSSMMDPQVDKWLMDLVLAGTSSMKAVRTAISQYDKEFPLAISVLECRISLSNANNDHADQAEGIEEVLFEFAAVSVGDYVRKFFPFHGWFEGSVEAINPGAPDGKVLRVCYLDNDEEDLTEEEFKKPKKSQIFLLVRSDSNL